MELLQVDQEFSYVSSPGKLFVFDAAGIEKEHFDLDLLIDSSASIFKEKGPGGWITLLTGSYFYQISLSERTLRPHPVNRFFPEPPPSNQNFAQDKAGNLWACGLDKTLLFYDAQQDTLFDFSKEFSEGIPDWCFFREVKIDRNGVVWVSTQLGLLKIVRQAGPFENFLTGTDAKGEAFSLRGITETSTGQLYIGTYSGIFQLDPVRNRTTLTPIPNNLPFYLYYQDSILWLNGGNAWDLRRDSLCTIGGSVTNSPDLGTLAQDDRGQLWWMINDRLSFRDVEELQSPWKLARRLPILPLSVCDVLYYGPNSQSLLIGIENTLFQYFPASDSLISYSALELGLPVSRIMAFHENRDGTLWIGTDLGLLHFDPSSHATKLYETSDGLPDNFVCGLLVEGDSCIWLSTNYGLSRFDIKEETFLNFFEIDGLPDNEFNRSSYYKARDGRMFFGGMRGLTSFYPEEIIQSYETQTKSFKLVLTAFEKADERRDTLFRTIQFGEGKILHIYHWDRSFKLEFALTDYSDPEHIQYSYMLYSTVIGFVHSGPAGRKAILICALRENRSAIFPQCADQKKIAGRRPR